MKEDLIQFQAKENPKKLGFTNLKTIKPLDLTPKELRRELNKSKDIIILGGSDEINRIALESKKTKMLISPERNREKDFMHFRNSGLNQVLCKLAKKNNITIAFTFTSILNAKNWEERAIIIGRILQNARLCRKYKIKTKFISLAKNKTELRQRHALESFKRVLKL